MQSLFSSGGITDWEGNPIAADSQRGFKSQSALDFLNSGKYKDESAYGIQPPSVEEKVIDTEVTDANMPFSGPVISEDMTMDD